MLVSAFVFGGIPEKAVKKASIEADIYLSSALLEEYRYVPLALEAQRKINHAQLKTLISGIAAFVAKAKIVQPKQKIQVCRDPEDDMLLECCLASNANILITGDKDLFDVKDSVVNLKILTPREFMEE